MISDAKPVAVASKTTNMKEKKYPQLDLKTMAIGFAWRTFRIYLAGVPFITIIAVHKPICVISTGEKKQTQFKRIV